MSWLVDVDSAVLGEVNCQCVEALDQTHRISVWVIGRKCRQSAVNSAVAARH
jgi:hypothetical protein